MTPGREQSKSLTSTTKEGQTSTATQAQKVVMQPQSVVATPGTTLYTGESDSAYMMSGAGSADIASGTERAPHRWGHVSPSGSRFEINDSAGAERIEIQHHSGAGISIDPDGGVFITSMSQRGVGIDASRGDYYIASNGHVMIRGGAGVSVDTPGDFTLNVGGTFFLKCGAMSVITDVMSEIVNGTKVTSIKNDNSVVIGGIKRESVAGDSRMQVTGQYIEDIGANHTQRISGNSTSSVKGKRSTLTKGDADVSTGGKESYTVGGAFVISSKGDLTIATSGAGNFSGSSVVEIVSGSNLKLTGSEVNASPAVDLALWSDQTAQAGLAVSLGGSLGSKPSPQAGSSKTVGSVTASADAQVVDAKDIVDNITTEREIPEYTGNGKLEHANVAALGTISHDEQPGAQAVYDKYTSGNSGNANPSTPSETIANLPEEPVNRDPNIAPTKPGSVPGYGQYGAKISKYFTLAQIVNGTTTKTKPSPNEWDKIVGFGAGIAQNLLDPINEKFPGILVTSWYRPGTKNHGTGRAIDIVVPSRSMAKHAEIARFARDNLPVSQVFLEKNSTGNTHVHLMLATGKGKPVVLTCGDKNCHSKTPGIDVAYLLKRGVKTK